MLASWPAALGCVLGLATIPVVFGFTAALDRNLWMVGVSVLVIAAAVSLCPYVSPSAKAVLPAFHGSAMAWVWLAGLQRTNWPVAPGLGNLQAGLGLAAVFSFFFAAAWLRKSPKLDLRFGWLGAGLVGCWLVAFFGGPQGAPGGFPGLLELWFGLSPETADVVSTLLRKVVHFVFYGCLAWSFAQGLLGGGASKHGAIGLSLVTGLVHAMIDEGRQTATVLRSGSAMDVLLDCVGMAFFLWLGRGAFRPPKAG